MKNKISNDTQVQAMKVAKGTQKKALNKEQTKLIAQGIEKGIAEYKKQQAKKNRDIDKQRKQKAKQQAKASFESTNPVQIAAVNNRQSLPWLLLLISWLGFAVYVMNF
jgi:hypothetical protein